MLYRGGSDHSAIQAFKRDGEVLISTDNGAKGFNLEETSFVIHYDLPYNTLKMEQRIDRCHWLGQENDVLSPAFLNQHNLADVRKLALASKRTLVSNGVFGLTDSVLGGFTGDLEVKAITVHYRFSGEVRFPNMRECSVRRIKLHLLLVYVKV